MLSTTSQHAVRALVHLADAAEGSSLLGRELSAVAGIPANFLSKIMLTLRNAGIVDATRGQGGGYRLLQRPDQIRLITIVDLFDGVVARPSCFLGEKHACDDEHACSAHAGWKVVCHAYLHFMTTTTIADIGLKNRRPPSPLHSLLR